MIRAFAAVGLGLLIAGYSVAATSPSPARSGVAASEAITVYRTRDGDTLGSLATRYMSGWRDVPILRSFNRLKDSSRVPVGVELRIPTRLLRSSPISLTASAVTGSVTRSGGAGASRPLAKGDVVREGDTISTGANSFATLAQADGSRITLPSQTRLRVAILRQIVLGGAAESNFIIESGKGEMSVTPMRKPSDRFEIRTPAAVAAVRGTEFRVGYDPAKFVSTLEVLHGRVGESATDGGPSADIANGLAAQRPLGGERSILTLPPAPVLLPPDKIQFPLWLTLRVAAPHPGWSYHFVLARDPDFVDVLAESVTSTGVARFDATPPGMLSAKITAIDEHGIEGFAKLYAIQRLTASSAPATGR